MGLREGLTRRRERFVDEYLVDMNGAAAAVRAGFSPRSSRAIAHEILTKPDVRAALRERQAVLAAKLEIERIDVVRGLLAAVDMARELQQPAAMVAALREMAKVLGFYAPESLPPGADSCALAARGRLEAMTDEQLTVVIGDGSVSH